METSGWEGVRSQARVYVFVWKERGQAEAGNPDLPHVLGPGPLPLLRFGPHQPTETEREPIERTHANDAERRRDHSRVEPGRTNAWLYSGDSLFFKY